MTRLSAAALLVYTSYAMCRLPVLPLYAHSLGAGPAQIGIVMAMSTMTGVLLKAPAGAVSDAIGRGAVLLAAGFVFSVLPFVYLVSGSLAALMAIRAVHGSATALFGPVAAATVSDLATPSRRGGALGRFSAVQGAGQAAGAAAAGWLVGLGLPAVFLTSGVLGTLGLMLVARGTWPHASERETVPSQRAIESLRLVTRNRSLLLVSGLQAGLMAVSGAASAFLPLFASDVLAVQTSTIGLVVAAQVIATLAVRPLAGGFSDRAGRASVIQTGLVSVAAGILLVATATGLTQLVVASVLFGAGLALAGAAATALVTDLSRRSGYGAAHGVFGTIYDVGDAAGPIVAGLFVAGFGHRPLFVALAVWSLMLAAGTAAVRAGYLSRYTPTSSSTVNVHSTPDDSTMRL